MRSSLLLLLLAFGAAGQTPVVTILGLHQPSHSSVSVDFTFSGSASWMRAHTSLPGGTCESVTTGVYSIQTDSHNGTTLNNRKFWPYDDGTSSPLHARVIFFGLLPNTSYRLCPEISADGNTWTSGVGIAYTTPALPAIHPVPPIAPVTFDTSYPNTTGYTTYSAPSLTCSNFQSDIDVAVNNLIVQGAVFNSPDCTTMNLQFNEVFPDHIDFTEGNMNATSNTLGNPAYPGGTCGANSAAGQIPCLGEGMQVKLSIPNAYNGNPPAHLWDRGYNTGQIVPYLFYVHFPNGGDTSQVQLFYPKPYSQCSTCLWTLGDTGSNNSKILNMFEIPRPLKWIVIRTPTPDPQFAPLETRINPSWDSKMAHWAGWNITTQVQGDDKNQGVGHIYIRGIHLSIPPTGEVSPNPVTISPMLNVHQDTDTFILDQDWLEGPTFPDKIKGLSNNFDGAFIAIKNCYTNKMRLWHATSTWAGISPYNGAGIINGPASGTSFTIGPGEAHGGAFDYKQTSTMTVQLGGTPTNQSGPSRGIVYFDSTGAIKVAVPPGMESQSSTTIGSIVSGPSTYNNASDLKSPVLPQESARGQSRPAVFPIAFYDVQPSGTLSYVNPAYVYDSSCDQSYCEGSDTFVLGRGPGPWLLLNSYVEAIGNSFNRDDSLDLNNNPSEHDVGDDTIQRNFFFHDYNTIRSAPGWNGNIFLNRHALEYKNGSRIHIIGNAFVGPSGCDGMDATATTFNPKTPAGDVNDINFEFNTISGSCGLTGIGTYYSTNHLLADTMSRFRIANNLIQNTNAWKNDSYFSVTAPNLAGGVGWMVQANGGFEDFSFVHNTVMPTDGLKPLFMPLKEPAEGVQIDDNLLFYSTNNNAVGMFALSDNQTPLGATIGSSCLSAGVDKPLMDCLWKNYSFSHNLIIPGYNSNNVLATNCQNPSVGDACFERRNLYGNVQVSTNQVCTAFGGTLSNGICSGGLPSTVLNLQSGVDAAVAALSIMNPSANFASIGTLNTDYHPRSDSPLISGGPYKASDGKDVGADIEGLLAAQGYVQLIGVPTSSITSSTAMVAWIAPDSQSCPVDVSSTDSNVISTFTRFADTGTTRVRNVSLTGLQSRTTYSYRINCAVSQPTGQFRTY